MYITPLMGSAEGPYSVSVTVVVLIYWNGTLVVPVETVLLSQIWLYRVVAMLPDVVFIED